MADKSHFHECPICGQSFGEAVFETHVDLCIKQSFIKDAAKAPAIFNSAQLADQVADIEARLFSFLDNLEGSPPDIRCDIDTQKSTRHLHNSLVNARRRLCQIYERLGVEFENGSHAILVQPAKVDGQHVPVPHRPLPAPPRQPVPPSQPPPQSPSQQVGSEQKEDYVMVNAPAPPIPPRLGEIGSRTLHSVSMSSLRSALVLPGDAEAEEKGARSASSTLSGALTTMEERLFAEFLRKEGTCSVCRQVKGPEVVLVMEKCDHRVCPDCLATFLRRALKSAEPSGKLSAMDLTCPASSKCRHRVPDWMCKRVLPAEEYEALEQATLKSFIDSSNLVTCPNPKCGQVFEPVAGNVDGANQEQVGPDGKPLSQEAKEHRAKYRFRCQMCQTIFCSQCAANPYHLGYSCDQWKMYQEAKHCRFCSTALTPNNTAPVTVAGAVPNVCTLPECLAKRDKSCLKTLRCGHACGGIANEGRCLPCLEDGCKSKDPSGSKEDYCNICWIESIGSAPSIQLGCGHIFHWQCVLDKVQRKWAGARIAFGFLNCPLCKKQMTHPALDTVMRPYLELFNKVQEKAVHRLKVEGLDKDKRLSEPNGKYLGKPALYAMDIFAYYICFKCQDPYFGGRRACEEAAREDDAKYDPKELVCGSCSSGGDTTKCKTHGKDYIEFKCKWCCDIATYFCWGTTHFCASCHKRQEQGDYLTKKPRSALPVCPGKALCKLGVDHPPNGEEFALGCAICRHLN